MYTDPNAPGGGYYKVGAGITKSILNNQSSQFFTRDFTSMNVYDGANNTDWTLIPWLGDRIQNVGPINPLATDVTGSGPYNVQLTVRPNASNSASGAGCTRAQHLATTSEMTVTVPFGGQAVSYTASRGEYPVIFGSGRSRDVLNDGNPDDSTVQVGNLFLTSNDVQDVIGQTFAQYAKPTVLVGASSSAVHVSVGRCGASSPGRWFEVGSTTPAPASARQVVPNNGVGCSNAFYGCVFDTISGSGPSADFSTSAAPFAQHHHSSVNRQVPEETALYQCVSDASGPGLDPDHSYVRTRLLESYGYTANDSMKGAGVIHFVDNPGNTDVIVIIETADKYAVMYQANSVVGSLQAPTLSGIAPKHDESLGSSGQGPNRLIARRNASATAIDSLNSKQISVSPQLQRAMIQSQHGAPLINGSGQSNLIAGTGQHVIHHIAGPPTVRPPNLALGMAAGAGQAALGVAMEDPATIGAGLGKLARGVYDAWTGHDRKNTSIDWAVARGNLRRQYADDPARMNQLIGNTRIVQRMFGSEGPYIEEID